MSKASEALKRAEEVLAERERRRVAIEAGEDPDEGLTPRELAERIRRRG